jgi:hypothetical protein
MLKTNTNPSTRKEKRRLITLKNHFCTDQKQHEQNIEVLSVNPRFYYREVKQIQ